MDTRIIGRLLAIGASALALHACAPSASMATPADNPSPEELAARGLAAAEHFPGLASLCDLTMVFQNVNVPRPVVAEAPADAHEHEEPQQRTPRGSGRDAEQARLAPMQVFDDLYFVGNAGVSAWLVGTEEDGYVLFDALNSNAEAERDIIGGMRSMGLDPGKIRHFIVSHGHGDHYGGHRYLVETLGLPVSMSAPDWALARTLGVHPRFGPAPTEGEVIEDGQVITLGKTVIRLFVTSAHTPGTISPIITVHDNGVPHNAVLWGGTGMNFGPDEAQLRRYAASAARLRELSRDLGVDIFMSNHSARDGSAASMRQLATRQPAQPHPFVRPDAVNVFDVLEFCPLAQAERIARGQYNPAS
jgi:metallo-beta-lactamase class B